MTKLAIGFGVAATVTVFCASFKQQPPESSLGIGIQRLVYGSSSCWFHIQCIWLQTHSSRLYSRGVSPECFVAVVYCGGLIHSAYLGIWIVFLPYVVAAVTLLIFYWQH